MDLKTVISCRGFEWDKGNANKNWHKHQVSQFECEAVFFNLPIVIEKDLKHSKKEDRFYLLGETDEQRVLFVVFTIRNNNISVISARDANKKEKEIYYGKKNS